MYKKEEPKLKRWKKLMAPVGSFTDQTTQSNPTNFVGLLCLINTQVYKKAVFKEACASGSNTILLIQFNYVNSWFTAATG